MPDFRLNASRGPRVFRHTDAQYSAGSHSRGSRLVTTLPGAMSMRYQASPYFSWGSKAKDFFADPYFYGDLEDVATFCAGKREKAFGEQRVFEVMKNLKTNVQVTEFFMAVGIQGSRVILCMGRDYAKSIEDTLHDEEIVALNGESEIDLVNERFVPLRSYAYPTVIDASEEIVCVFGPSGIGKTFFAVKHVPSLKVHGTWKQQRCVTFYMKPFDLDFFRGYSDERALVDWIKTKVEDMYGRFDKLEMRVALVLDDLYKHGERGDAWSSFRFFYDELRNFAREVVIIEVGSRVPQYIWKYGGNSFLKPLSNSDMKTFASQRPFNLDDSVVDALCCVPSLAALTTDARSAWLLLKAVKDGYPVEEASQSSWLGGLRDRAPGLAAAVVNSFVQETRGLQGFDDEARRRVAAWVIHTAHAAKRNLKEMPQFTGLMNEEKNAAASLMCVNLQDYGSELRFIEGRGSRAVSLSPAMEFVLLSVLRGPKAVVAMYDSGPAGPGATWAHFRRRVVAFVDRRLKAAPTLIGNEANQKPEGLA
jgi:hypothetical protein